MSWLLNGKLHNCIVHYGTHLFMVSFEIKVYRGMRNNLRFTRITYYVPYVLIKNVWLEPSHSSNYTMVKVKTTCESQQLD